MHRIVFLDRATIAPQIQLRPPAFRHILVEHEHTLPEQVAERLAGASIAIDNKVPLDATTLARLPDLKLIAVAATGTDCIDKAYCQAHRVAVSNIRTLPGNVLSQMEGSGTKLNIVLLDACRNNPFGGRGLRVAAGGLAQMQAPEGTLISYATQPGNVALVRQ
jgi:D-isomer specific 2-hydroxyacid dehydrogenase, catalytic domain